MKTERKVPIELRVGVGIVWAISAVLVALKAPHPWASVLLVVFVLLPAARFWWQNYRHTTNPRLADASFIVSVAVIVYVVRSILHFQFGLW